MSTVSPPRPPPLCSGDKRKTVLTRQNQNENRENSRHKAVATFTLSNKSGGQVAFELAVTSPASASLRPGGTRHVGIVSPLMVFAVTQSPSLTVVTALPVDFRITQRRRGILLLEASLLP